MSFGFSVGDFLAVGSLIKDVVVSLKDAGGAAADYQQLIVELHGLQRALDSIEHLHVDPGTPQAENINNLKVTALGCRYVLEEALKKLRSYESLRLGQKSSSLVTASGKKIKWQIMMREDVDALRTRLNSHTNYLTMRLSTEILRGATAATTRTDESLGVVVQKLEETRVDIQEMRSDLEDNKVGKILDWVSPPALRMYDKQQDTFSRHQEDTGGWLLETPEFVRWLEKSSNHSNAILWCPGHPGAGKTVMSSMVVDHIQTNFRSLNVGVAFFYCDYKQGPTAFNILSSLARQLAEKGASPELFAKLYKEHNNGSSQLLFEELQTILVALYGEYDQVYLLIDALDECPLAEERTLVLDTIKRKPQPSVKILITSRPNFGDINSALVGNPRIDIIARDVDIKLYLRHRIRGNPAFLKRIAKDDLEEQIINEITTRASGMYLMAVLQIERILTERTPSKIRKALQTLPSKLEANYQDTIKRIRRQAEPDNEYGLRILQWVSASHQPLSVQQLALALSIEWNDDEEPPHSIDPDNVLDPDSIVDVCGGLVIIEPASQEVRLVHFTVQEFFSKNPSVLPNTHHEICKTCLLYLSLDDVSKQLEYSFDRICKETYETYPSSLPEDAIHDFGIPVLRAKKKRIAMLEARFPLLLEYAARFYLSHAQRTTFDRSLEKLFTLFFKSQRRMVVVYSLTHKYLKLHSYLGPDHELTGLHVLAALGTPALASLYLKIYPGVDPKSLRGKTPLYCATLAEQVPMMSYLVSNGADVNAQDVFGMTPLLVATRNFFIRGVELLLENGADVNLVSGKDHGYRSALHFAVGDGNEHLVKLLVDGGADLELQKHNGFTPLLEAVCGDHFGILRILLHAGARADVRDKEGRSALSWATPSHSSTNKNYDMMHLLLEAGATRDEGDIHSVGTVRV